MPAPTSLRQRALAYLARREHARAELRQKLLPHIDGDTAALEALLDDFVERGWLSDARFAEAWAHSRGARYGGQRLRAELRGKGVDATLIAETLGSMAASEEARAREVWQRKFGSPPQDARERARQLRFLAARGFPLDIVYRVVGGDDETV
ncbi:MAG TPA: recombination regulator RecX [Chitinolyticbacter sp.]|nr:recombination regulator RecX [Chitinolyticbacter sp.]